MAQNAGSAFVVPRKSKRAGVPIYADRETGQRSMVGLIMPEKSLAENGKGRVHDKNKGRIRCGRGKAKKQAGIRRLKKSGKRPFARPEKRQKNCKKNFTFICSIQTDRKGK